MNNLKAYFDLFKCTRIWCLVIKLKTYVIVLLWIVNNYYINFSALIFRQQERLVEIEKTIALLTNKVDALLKKLDTLDNVRKGPRSK